MTKARQSRAPETGATPSRLTDGDQEARVLGPDVVKLYRRFDCGSLIYSIHQADRGGPFTGPRSAL
jgi:hypothetical protein